MEHARASTILYSRNSMEIYEKIEELTFNCEKS
jgi:hypothetical protein